MSSLAEQARTRVLENCENVSLVCGAPPCVPIVTGAQSHKDRTQVIRRILMPKPPRFYWSPGN
jgi:hypothetical protein